MPTEVIIDGVKYVPAREVLVDSNLVIETLLQQFWGVALNDKSFEYISNLRILVSDGLSEHQGESFEEFIARLAEAKDVDSNV